MTYLLLFLFFAGCFGLLTSTVFAAMVVAGARHHFRNLSRSGSKKPLAVESFTPALSLLKPLHGSEPDLEPNLVTFFEQDYPPAGYEILFCAADIDDAGLEIARRVAARYPHVPVRFFSAGRPRYINAKVQSLEVMAAAAAHGILVVSDSDVRVTPTYLPSVAEPFRDPKVGASTCLYRGVAAEGGLWARLEAVGMSVEMTAGVLVANMLEGMQFVLGPTMAFRRECIDAMGGFGVTANYCSDDYILGNEAHKLGWQVALCRHSIDHMVIHSGLLASLRHQIRWMKSTRFSRPKGHFGTALTFSLPFGIVAAWAAWEIGHPLIAAALFAWSLVTRWIIAWAAGRLVVGDRSYLGLFLLYPIRDLMGFGFWALSYISTDILWRGQVYQLLPGGKMRAAK